MALCFNDGAFRSFKISQKSLVQILKTMPKKLCAKACVKQNFQSSIFTKKFSKVVEVDFGNNAFEVQGLIYGTLTLFWDNKIFYKIFSILLLFTYSILSSFKISENLESGFQKKIMLGLGSNLGHIRNFVKCRLFPFLFTCFDLLSSKNSEQILRTK